MPFDYLDRAATFPPTLWKITFLQPADSALPIDYSGCKVNHIHRNS